MVVFTHFDGTKRRVEELRRMRAMAAPAEAKDIIRQSRESYQGVIPCTPGAIGTRRCATPSWKRPRPRTGVSNMRHRAGEGKNFTGSRH